MDKYCSGCGKLLQYDNKDIEGYIPFNKYDDTNYCMRCFKLIHYGSSYNNKEYDNEYILNYINNKFGFKVFLTDLLNINNYVIDLQKINGNKLLVITKVDLLDKTLNKNKIKIKLKNIYNINEDIIFISTNKEYNIHYLVNYLKNKKENNIYFLGTTNSGKSSLINKIIELYDIKRDNLTVSNKKNTTLEFININNKELFNIIDSPGFIIKDYNLNIKYKNIIKPITFNMKKDEVINIDKFYIKFKEQSSITIYTYENSYIKKYYKDIEFKDSLEVSNNIDLCINGFGFINIKSKNNLLISNLDINLISTRKSIFGDNDGQN